MSVAFVTKCWDKDWQRIISGGMTKKVSAIGYPFDDRILVFNNGVPEEVWRAYRGSYITSGMYPEYFGVDSPNPYAIGELAAIYIASRYDYICYVQGDCITTGGDWVTPGIAILESEPDVLLVSPLSEVNTRGEYDQYCSDQAFLCRASDLAKPEVYSYRTIDPDYPDYGGLSFEHLVGNYMKATGKQRKILSEFWTHHPQY